MKVKKIPEYIADEIEISSDDSDREHSDKENSNDENSNEGNKYRTWTLQKWMKEYKKIIADFKWFMNTHITYIAHTVKLNF